MLEQVLEMISFKSQACLTPGEHIIKHCLKFLSGNCEYCAQDETVVSWVTHRQCVVACMITLNRHIFPSDLLCVTRVKHILKTVSTKTVQREFHKPNMHGRVAISKPLTTENNAKRRKRWCNDHKTWTFDWKHVIWSDESSSTLFPTSGWVCVWRTPKEVYNPECLVPTVKHGGGSVLIWAAISWYSAGPIITLNCRVTASGCADILGNQVHPVVQVLFPNNDAVFEDGNSPTHTARSVPSWFEQHEDTLRSYK
jgi:hypothetical protein